MSENVINRIIDDKRIIKGIFFNDADGSCYTRQYGFEIEAYGEEGMHCYVAFYAVKKDAQIVSRVPAWQVQVVYEDIK